MPCGEHNCEKRCHSGLCGKCMAECESRCYCGKSSKLIACSERRKKWSEVEEGEGSGITKWIGSFSCKDVCDKTLDCGIHKCQLLCHSRAFGDHPCPLQPKVNETCYCGAELVSVLLGHSRSSCEEPIPSCNGPCNKTLACGHACRSKCHSGECPPCLRISATKCGCENQLFDVPCTFVQTGAHAKCRRRCAALMDCRRHRCSEVCCPYEKKALERERVRKKKFRGKTTIENDEIIETIHQCTLVCNKPLNCGIHSCQMTCHNGPCIPCLESSMDDWHCSCGRTILRAPIRCGSMKPRCKYQCPRLPVCGHPRVEHECHDHTVECPKCPYLVEKLCVCGKETVKGVQCHRLDSSVSCGKACTEPLKCGHKCSKVCHPAGECETQCKSPCGRLLPCDHPHKAVCHSDSDCNSSDCKELVTVECACGNHSRPERCKGKAEKEILKCDESCAIKERNRRLAEALQIDLEKRGEGEHKYNDNLLDLYQTDPSWSDEIEQAFIQFGSEIDKKELRFPAMNSQRRMFVHLLAEEFQLPTYSLDSEPNRSVVVMRSSAYSIPAARLRKYYRPIRWD
jgi:transcriptional repressor NF-X1